MSRMPAIRSLVGAALLVTAALLALPASPASAATYDVTTTTDVVNAADGVLSLREALAEASAQAGADTVTLVADATYPLTNCALGQLEDTGADDLTIVGNGATIDQTCADTRVVEKTLATGTLTLSEVTLTGGANTGVLIDGAGVLSAGHLVLDGTTITGIANEPAGTVVEFVNSAAPLDVEILNSTIGPNEGRAVKNAMINGGVLVSGSTIDDNSGGGVELVDGSPLQVVDSVVSDNGNYGVRTTGQGSSVLSVAGSEISGNTNTGVSCGACGTVTVSGSTVTGNGLGTSAGGGGGIHATVDQDQVADAPTVTITDSTISDNYARRDGGGVSVDWIEANTATTPTQTTITGSTVSGNESDCVGCDGGGISVMIGSVDISETDISGNTASGSGGGLRHNRRDGDEVFVDTTLTISDSAITGNSAAGEGGGVAGGASTVDLDTVLVDGNTGDVGGGLALGGFFIDGWLQQGDITVDASTISANTALAFGGGLALRLPDGTNALVTNSTIHNNSAPTGGGVAAGLTEPFSARFSTITANSATAGANLAVSSFGTIGASVIAEPVGGGANCAPLGFGINLTFSGGSWLDDASCPTVADDVVDVGGDPELGALTGNGGATPTRLPAASSPLGGIVADADCVVSVDQRGESRPAGDQCDAGAVEFAETSASIVGTNGPNVLTGTSGNDRIFGLGGPDLLRGLGGDDELDGGPGMDILQGGPGADLLKGGSGKDRLIGDRYDTFVGGPGRDVCVIVGSRARVWNC